MAKNIKVVCKYFCHFNRIYRCLLSTVKGLSFWEIVTFRISSEVYRIYRNPYYKNLETYKKGPWHVSVTFLTLPTPLGIEAWCYVMYLSLCNSGARRLRGRMSSEPICHTLSAGRCYAPLCKLRLSVNLLTCLLNYCILLVSGNIKRGSRDLVVYEFVWGSRKSCVWSFLPIRTGQGTVPAPSFWRTRKMILTWEMLDNRKQVPLAWRHPVHFG